jgi:uncharacterized protein involved in exopolysaccharide biosynthesis
MKENRKVISILDFFIVLARHKKFIIGSTLISFILMFIFTMLAVNLPYDHEWNYFPDIYMPSAKVMITWEEQAVVQKVTKVTDSYSQLRPLMLPGVMNPFMEFIFQLITGNSVLDKVSEKCNLYEKLNTNEIGARNWLLKRISILQLTLTPLPNYLILMISFQHSNSEEATEILNAFLISLDEKFSELAEKQVEIRKNYILERIAIVEEEIKDYKDKMVDFQNEYGVIDINKQVDSQAALIIENKIAIMRKELDIELLRQYLPEDSSQIRIIRDEIETRKSFIRDLDSRYVSGFISLEKLQNVKDTFVDMQRNLNIQLSIYDNLIREYELIKIEETGVLDNFLVIEDPEVMLYPSAPIREFHYLIAIFSVLLISIILSCIKEYFVQLVRKPGEDEKYEEIKRHFKNKK